MVNFLLFSFLTISSFSISALSDSTYDIQIVDGMNIEKRAILGGVVISSSQVNLSSQVSGDILKVNGQEGDVFKKGDVLVLLEQDSIQAQKDSALAKISSAIEDVRRAKIQYEKSIVSPYANDMFGGAFSMFTDPMARFNGNNNPGFNKYANRASQFSGVQQAKNKLKQAESNLKQIESRLKDTSVVAPFDGVIIAKNINKGDVVNIGQTLMKFANIQNLQVEVNVPSALLRNLKLNKKYRIKLDISNIVVEAVLAQIYPIADGIKHSVKVKFDLPKNTPILAGAYAEVEILGTNSSKKTPVVPVKAIMWRSSLPSVFVVNNKNQTELRFVRLGEDVNKNRKSVLSGLKIGERLITNPNVMMVSGIDI